MVFGFALPTERTGQYVTVTGKTFRNATVTDINRSTPGAISGTVKVDGVPVKVKMVGKAWVGE